MADQANTIKLWGGIIEYEEPLPDARIDAVGKEFHLRLDAFEKNKSTLLTSLQKAREAGSASKPFDPRRSWSYLMVIAGAYIQRTTSKRTAIPASQRVVRLRDLANALGRARRMADKAMLDDVGADLFSAWRDANVIYDISSVEPIGPSTLIRIDDEFRKVVATLAVLENAASRAAGDVQTQRGRPRGTAVVPCEFVEELAELYLEETALKPGAGDGPFARFVWEFLSAIGQRNIEYESVVDAIKDARTQSLRRPRGSGCGASPFDEKS